MIKKFSIFVLSLTAIAIAVLLLVPASWVTRELSPVVPKANYEQTGGLWWRGYISDASVDIRGYRLAVGRVQWQYQFSSLFSDQACISFHSIEEALQTEGQLCYRWQDQSLVLNQLGVQLLGEELAAISGLELTGHFDAYFQTLRFSQNQLTAIDGDIAWQKAQWHNGEKWIDLGELLFTLINQSSQIEVQASDVESPLGIDLVALFERGDMASLEGYIEVTPTTDPSLLQTLDYFSNHKLGSRYIIRRGF